MNMRTVLSAALLAVAGTATAGELSCVTFPGTSYIRTDIMPTVDLRAVCEFQLLEAPQGIDVAGIFGSLGTVATNGSLNTGWGFRAQGPSNDGIGGWKGKFVGWSGNDGQPIAPVDLERHVVELVSGRVVMDGLTNTCGAARDPSLTNGGGLGLFDIADQGWHGANGLARVRIYKLQFFRTINGVETCVRDYVPYEFDGSYGLYEKVGGTFCAVTGTDPVMAGVWTKRPSVTPTRWNRRVGATPAIDMGVVTNTATVSCSHTAEQLAALPVGSHRVTFTTSSADPEMDGRVEHVILTVEEPLVATTTDNGATVSLTFPPATEARTLHLVYGTADKGADPSAWDHCVDVPVPTGTDALQVNAPEGFGAENPVWSALLRQPATAKNALSYVRHGNLMLQWDGEENAAYGRHDANLAFPAEIRSGRTYSATSASMAAEAKSFTLGSGYFQLASPLLQNLVNAGHATVEVVLEHGVNVNNGGIFALGNTSRGFWYYQKTDGTNPYYPGDVSYHAKMRDEYEIFQSGASMGTNTLAFALGANSNACYLAQNGVKLGVTHSQVGIKGGTQKFQRYGTDVADDLLTIGVLPGDWFVSKFKARAKVCSIRVYDQVLSLEEIQANAAVDAVRFRGQDFEQAGPYFAEVPLAITKVNKEAKIPVSADLVFTGSESVRRVYFAWDARDQGESLDSWAHVVSAGTVPSGVTTATVSIPAEARAAVAVSGGFRFFLETLVTAASYAQGDHLVAQFDGIENGGFGVHDASRSAPAELRHNLAVTATGKLDVGDKHFRLGVHSFNFACPALQTAVNEGHATVELVLATNGCNAVNNGGYFCIGDTARGFWLYQKNDYLGDFSYHAAMTGQYDTIAGTKFTGTNTFAFVLGADTANSFLAKDGEKQSVWSNRANGSIGTTLDRFATDSDDKCYVGVLPGTYLPNNYRPQALAYSIRLYDCVLTDAERALNYAIDRQRFRGEFAVSTASAFTRGCAGGLTVIIR